jgi:hypothetical protein
MLGSGRVQANNSPPSILPDLYEQCLYGEQSRTQHSTV